MFLVNFSDKSSENMSHPLTDDVPKQIKLEFHKMLYSRSKLLFDDYQNTSTLSDFTKISQNHLLSLQKRWSDYKVSCKTSRGSQEKCEKKLKTWNEIISFLQESLEGKITRQQPWHVIHKGDFLGRSKAVEIMFSEKRGEFYLKDKEKIFFDFLDDPLNFLAFNDYYAYLKGFLFYECACSTHLRSNKTIRSRIEQTILEDVVEKVKNKDDTLYIGSFGAGGLLSDLIIIGKLLREGYSDIHVTFIDVLNAQLRKDLEKEFCIFLNQLPRARVKVEYITLKELKALDPERRFQLLYSIDILEIVLGHPTCWEHITQVKNHLTEKGAFYIFSGPERFILDQRGNITLLNPILQDSVKINYHLTKTYCQIWEKCEDLHLYLPPKQKLNFSTLIKIFQVFSRECKNIHFYSETDLVFRLWFKSINRLLDNNKITVEFLSAEILPTDQLIFKIKQTSKDDLEIMMIDLVEDKLDSKI